MKSKSALFTFLVCSVCQTALAADYYVATDGSVSRNGTSASAWKTIGHGINQMASRSTSTAAL